MPAFGFSAVPLPTNNRTMLPGCHAPTAEAPAPTAEAPADTAEAPADTTADPTNDAAPEVAGSPLVTAAAEGAVRAVPFSSRRLTANAAHANGAATDDDCRHIQGFWAEAQINHQCG